MPFVHNIDPTLIQIGPITIQYYGVIYLLGFFVTVFYLYYMTRKKRLNLTGEDLVELLFYSIIAIPLGARLFHCFLWEPGYYLQNPLEILFFWQGGLSFHGGLAGMIAAACFFQSRKHIRNKITRMELADHLAIPIAFALALGRIGNFINGELPGRVTGVSWCWHFPGHEGCRHPQQLYAAFKRFVIVGLLVFQDRKKHKDGFLLWNFVMLFGIGRVLIDFFRDDPTFLGLTMGQYLSLVMFIVGAVVLLKYYRRDLKRFFKS
ncbi:prolipoprotein diacylglyceryl transferase [Candidatus Woesearchaeota archaeon]|nr:prolipoprotein diacylglyceryl transferase [Candidatus Woesearchaeota archaeon]